MLLGECKPYTFLFGGHHPEPSHLRARPDPGLAAAYLWQQHQRVRLWAQKKVLFVPTNNNK